MNSVSGRRINGALGVSALIAAYEGAWLIAGYFLATVPGIDQSTPPDQSAPHWLFFLGVALVSFGGVVLVAMYSVARRRGGPLVESPPLPTSTAFGAVVVIGAAIIPLAVVSFLATGSAIRYRPLMVAALLVVVCLPLSLWMSRDR